MAPSIHETAVSLEGLVLVASQQNLPVTLFGTAFVRLLLSSLRDELFTQPASKSRGDILEEAGIQGVQRPVVSNRSLILSSLFTVLAIAVDPSMCLTVAAATLGWELSGITYNIIGRIYPS